MNGFLELEDVSAGYGANRVLHGIDLAVGEGEFVALLGSSGCGKTTLLRTVAGFAAASGGAIRIEGREVTALPPDRRGMAMVFQSYALWPHMSVAANIGYGLKLKGWSRTDIAARVAEMTGLLGLRGLEDRKPGALSGGQRQRVALGRALAVDPQILLLDEPLSNLDARIRLQLRGDIRALQQRLGITALHVTHDREEAMVMADRLVILDGGCIAQQGAPQEVYGAPASAFVAAFMGAENRLDLGAEADGEGLVIAAGPGNARFPLRGNRHLTGPGEVEARFRPAAPRLIRDGEAVGDGLELAGTVRAVGYPGGVWRHRIAVGEAGSAIEAGIEVDLPLAVPVGAPVRLLVPREHLFLFPAAAGAHASRPLRDAA